MKKLLLPVALCVFTGTVTAAEVQIRKDTEVCKVSKTGKSQCHLLKPKAYHYKQKSQHRLGQRKQTHLKRKPLHCHLR